MYYHRSREWKTCVCNQFSYKRLCRLLPRSAAGGPVIYGEKSGRPRAVLAPSNSSVARAVASGTRSVVTGSDVAGPQSLATAGAPLACPCWVGVGVGEGTGGRGGTRQVRRERAGLKVRWRNGAGDACCIVTNPPLPPPTPGTPLFRRLTR